MIVLAPNLVARITAAKADGTFPHGLSDADLQAMAAGRADAALLRFWSL